MLDQFQVCYPTGSLISELLQIYQGKFVVRVSVQVEGVTRATGMAAAETLELAEDRARSRALAVLVMQPQSTQAKMQVEKEFSPEPPTYSYVSQASPPAESIPAPAVPPELKGNSVRNTWAPNPTAKESDAKVENFGITSGSQTESSGNPPLSFGNVTPLVPRSYSPQDSVIELGQTDAEVGKMATSEPIDLLDAIARTTIELKRLGWSNQQGREYLQQTYNKRSRHDLNNEEMLEFLHYLESQPSPNEPFA